MIIEIDGREPTSLFEQIAAQLRGAILRGDVRSGERLPTARELAGSLDVNVHTVLRAYGDLRDEGLLEIRRGRGVTVVGVPPRARARQLAADLVAEARRLGLTPREVQALVREQL